MGEVTKFVWADEATWPEVNVPVLIFVQHRGFWETGELCTGMVTCWADGDGEIDEGLIPEEEADIWWMPSPSPPAEWLVPVQVSTPSPRPVVVDESAIVDDELSEGEG